MEKEIEIEGLRINYAETGVPEGPPVLLLHGWGCNLSTVRSIAACLEDKMRVFSLDLPGHGKSEEPREIWGTKDFANLVGKFVEMLGLKRPSLIGHSFGGRTSIAYCAGNPEIEKVVLVDSAGIKPYRSLSYYYKVYSYKALKKLAILLKGEEKGKELIERALKKKGSADYQAASPKMRAIMSRCVNEDLKPLLPQIKSPTLLIWGQNDTATPLRDAKIMDKLIPDSGLVCFSNCGHYSFLDNPHQFRAVVRSFFGL
ncbi:MAG: alpha/beta hydrolase [Muribaculaceae bacterium]|nr:alpha/beta hydrolase [Muribaculaceae bacterium]